MRLQWSHSAAGRSVCDNTVNLVHVSRVPLRAPRGKRISESSGKKPEKSFTNAPPSHTELSICFFPSFTMQAGQEVGHNRVTLHLFQASSARNGTELGAVQSAWPWFHRMPQYAAPEIGQNLRFIKMRIMPPLWPSTAQAAAFADNPPNPAGKPPQGRQSLCHSEHERPRPCPATTTCGWRFDGTPENPGPSHVRDPPSIIPPTSAWPSRWNNHLHSKYRPVCRENHSPEGNYGGLPSEGVCHHPGNQGSNVTGMNRRRGRDRSKRGRTVIISPCPTPANKLKRKSPPFLCSCASCGCSAGQKTTRNGC